MTQADRTPVCMRRDTRNGSLLNRKAVTASDVKHVAHRTTTRCGRVMRTRPEMSAVNTPVHMWSRLSRNTNSRHSNSSTLSPLFTAG